MFNKKIILLFFTSLVLNFIRESVANNLSKAVTLGGAIIAVEENEIQEKPKMETQKNFNNANCSILHYLKDKFRDKETAQPRGKYLKKHKMLKHLYPLLIGAVLAKTLVVPLVLKLLTALSASSFIMAKIALATSGLLALKWIFADSEKEHTHFEIVYLPEKSGLSQNNLVWLDPFWKVSSFADSKLTKTLRLKYIPLSGKTDDLQSSLSSNKAIKGSNAYRYSYDGSLDGKPFL